MVKSSGVTSSPGYTGTVEYKTDLVAAHELLNVTVKELGTKRGTPLMVSVNVNTPFPEFVPEVKKGYVYGDFELIKDIFMMLELGIRLFVGSCRNRQIFIAYTTMCFAQSSVNPCPTYSINGRGSCYGTNSGA